MTKPTMPNDYPAGSHSDSIGASAPAALLDDLTASKISFDISTESRAQHGRDWWPLSIRDVNEGRVPHWPGVVVTPTTTEEVSKVVKIAAKHKISVTPQGGRSGVVGGAVAVDGAIALDLTGLDKIININADSGLVHVEAGVFGPDLEKAVNEKGWTVGHFPQSFDLATVGGWLACRGAGQFSNRYGKIEDIVRGLTVVLANGDIVKIGDRGPRQAVGPDLLQLFVGSEGTLGVITEATLLLRVKPTYELRSAYSFDTFKDGLDACQNIYKRGAKPAVLRLYDEAESKRNFQIEQCALIVLDEGDQGLCDATMEVVAEECSKATKLDDAHVATWLSHRNNVSSLVPLWEAGIIVDTIEVSGSWDILSDMHQKVVAALKEVPTTMAASVHQSHAYDDGACLYFTFAGRPGGDPTNYYRSAWDAASKTVLASGGALSHHHGVGRNRARFVKEALGSSFEVLQTMKRALDPENIMNPGALGIGGEPW